MLRPLAVLGALLCAGCLATAGDLDQLTANITGRIDEVAQDASASAEAAREAWKRGDITYAELQAELADIRAGVLDVAGQTTREVVDGLKRTLAERPEAVASAAGGAARTFLPGPWGEVVAALLAGGGAYAASTRKAREELEELNNRRNMARLMRGERADMPIPPKG